MNNCKNYKDSNGDRQVFGGTVVFTENCVIEGLEASSEAKGLVKQGVSVADAAGSTPTSAEFNALLDSLRDAGIIAEPVTE